KGSIQPSTVYAYRPSCVTAKLPRQRSLTSGFIGASVHCSEEWCRYRRTDASESWPSANTSASTTTTSPIERLDGNRPASTSGVTASTTTRRRALAGSGAVVPSAGDAEDTDLRRAGARATAQSCHDATGSWVSGRTLNRVRLVYLVEGADHGRALVFDVVHAGGLGDATRLSGANVQLQPQRAGADGSRLARDRGRVGGGPEDVDEVDLLLHLGERSVDPLAEQLVGVRVDGDDPKPALLEAVRNRAAGLARIPRGTDHGDRGRPTKDLLRSPGHGETTSCRRYLVFRIVTDRCRIRS